MSASNKPTLVATLDSEKLGFRLDSEMKVVKVEADSPAFEQGIKANYILIGVNSESLVELAFGDAVEKIKAAERPRKLEFIIPKVSFKSKFTDKLKNTFDQSKAFTAKLADQSKKVSKIVVAKSLDQSKKIIDQSKTGSKKVISGSKNLVDQSKRVIDKSRKSLMRNQPGKVKPMELPRDEDSKKIEELDRRTNELYNEVMIRRAQEKENNEIGETLAAGELLLEGFEKSALELEESLTKLEAACNEKMLKQMKVEQEKTLKQEEERLEQLKKEQQDKIEEFERKMKSEQSEEKIEENIEAPVEAEDQ